MTSERLQVRRAALVIACMLGMFARGVAQADASSGTWTGAVEAHGNYYLERSTRVVMPEFSLELESPSGVELGVEYLVDVISSASIAQGAGEDAVFTEYRQQLDTRVGYEFDAGAPLKLRAGFTYSGEDDYTSRIYRASAALSLWERNTTLSLTGSFTDDTVLSNADPLFEEDKRAVTLGSSIEQVLNPQLLFTLGYGVSILDGYLGNPYRAGPPTPENHPRERTRHAAYARLAWFIPASDTAVRLSYRAYVDTWQIGALNPEVRIIQTVHDDLLLSAHYRLYAQSAAFFFRRVYPSDYEGPVTADPKMAAHETHTVGGRIDWRLAFMHDAGMPWLARGWAIFTFDRYYNTNVFGDGYIATVGGRLPF